MEGLSEVQRAEVIRQIAVTKEQNAARAAQAQAAAAAAKKAKEAAEGGAQVVQQVQGVMADAKPEKLNAWVDVGVQLGKGMAAVAKEMNTAVNDFVKTPVGIMTASVILYKFMGRDIIKLLSGLAFGIIGMSVWIYLIRRVAVVDRVVYHEDVKEVAPNKKIKVKHKETVYGDKWKNTEGGTKFMFFITAIAIPAVSLLVILS